MPINETISRAKTELEKNRLWRSKEILQGALITYGYDIELYEAYGLTLLKMGDLVEAGRFLFLSAKRKNEYLEAIDIYKSKCFKNGATQIYSTFPSKAKLNKFSDYPDIIKKELEDYGFPEILKANSGEVHFGGRSRLSKFLDNSLPFIFLVFFGALIILGLIKGCEIIF